MLKIAIISQLMDV